MLINSYKNHERRKTTSRERILLFKIIMEVNGMTPKDLANFYVERAFNSRSKLKLSKYGIYGIDFPTKENLDKDIDEFNESEELEEEKTDSQDFLSDDFDVDQNNNKKDNNENDDDSEDKPEEDDPDDLCPF